MMEFRIKIENKFCGKMCVDMGNENSRKNTDLIIKTIDYVHHSIRRHGISVLTLTLNAWWSEEALIAFNIFSEANSS